MKHKEDEFSMETTDFIIKSITELEKDTSYNVEYTVIKSYNNIPNKAKKSDEVNNSNIQFTLNDVGAVCNSYVPYIKDIPYLEDLPKFHHIFLETLHKKKQVSDTDEHKQN